MFDESPEQSEAEILEELRIAEQKLALLRARQAEARIAAQKIEADRLAAANKAEIIIISGAVSTMSGRELWITCTENITKRDDVLGVFKSTPSRIYDWRAKHNVIAITDWNELRDRLLALDNVILTNVGEMDEYVQRKQDAPHYLISRHNPDTLRITIGDQGDPTSIRYFTGVRRMGDNLTLPMNETYRLYTYLNSWRQRMPTLKVVYDEDIEQLALTQISRREQLSVIKTQLDAPEIQPKLLNGYAPRGFQRADLKFMQFNGWRTLVANPVGLGKTIEGISAHQLLKEELGKSRIKTFVIIPAKLRENWLREIEKFVGSEVLSCHGLSPEITDYANILGTDSTWEFVLISYNSLRHQVRIEGADNEDGVRGVSYEFPWAKLISLAKPDLVIFDEIHYAKDHASKQSQSAREITTPRVIGLSATPAMNRPGELQPILQIIDPIQFNNYADFVARYDDGYGNARNVSELRELIDPLMIRRRREDVQKDVPPVERIARYYDLTEEQWKIYKKALAGIYDLLDEGISELNITNVLVEIQRCKQILSWSAIDTSIDLAQELYEQSEGENHRKVIIFTQFVESPSVLHEIRRKLGHEAISIDGQNQPTSRDKQAVIDRFTNEQQIKYLIASSKAVDAGLNIPIAGFTIFNDLLWTPQAHNQCEGRAFGRESDPHGIDSYYLLASKTILMWIWEILNKKLKMEKQLMDGEMIDDDGDTSVLMSLMTRLKEEK